MRIFLVLIMVIMFNGCFDDSPVAVEKVRVGAICNDGTKSDATGSGACSHHGGVKEWLYR